MKRIMIVGCARSGTTLLQQLIGTHPDVFTSAETIFFAMLLRSHGMGLCDRFYLPKRRFLKWKNFVEKNDILKLDMNFPYPKNRREAVRYFIQTMDFNAIRNQKKCWLEKTPIHLFSLRYILPMVPDIYVLHIIRKPENVVASIKNLSDKYPQIWWRKRLPFQKNRKIIFDVKESIMTSLSFVGQPNHYFVRYECLVNDPAKELKKIFDSLQLEMNAPLLKYILNHFSQTNVIRDEELWKFSHREKVYTDQDNKFEKLFNVRDREFIEARLYSVNELLKEKLGS